MVTCMLRVLYHNLKNFLKTEAKKTVPVARSELFLHSIS